MKQLMLIIFVSVLILVVVSCKKDHHSAATINGKWELSKISGQIIIDFPAGNGNTLEFTNNDYKIYKNGIPDKEGTYVLVPDGSVSESVCLNIPADQYKDRIVYDEKSDSTKEFVQLSGNKLFIISGCYAFDGGSTREYVKK